MISRRPLRAVFISSLLVGSRAMASLVTSSSSAQWHSVMKKSIKKSRAIRGGNYVQLATVQDGAPRVRTVVFRGWLPNTNHPTMSFITDKRSSKVAECAVNSSAEVCWWFPVSSEQFRLRGELKFVGEDHPNPELLLARQTMWEKQMRDSAREQFFWVGDPGTSYTPEPEAASASEGDQIPPPPPNFLLALLQPTFVDYLRLKDNYRETHTFVEPSWTQERVNP